MALSGTGFISFASALVLLGVGWNFLYIGGTTLLTTTYTAAEKGRAQAINYMTIFAVGLVCSFSAGALLDRFRVGDHESFFDTLAAAGSRGAGVAWPLPA